MWAMVSEEIDRATVGMGLAVVLAGVALALPWWTTTGTGSFGTASVGGETGAGPFDAGPGLAETWEAVPAGVLALAAFLGFLVAFLGAASGWDARNRGVVSGAEGDPRSTLG